MKIYKNKLSVIGILMIMILTLVGCSGPVKQDKDVLNAEDEISITGDSSESITLVGIGNQDIQVTVDEIKQLKMIKKDVISVSASGEETEFNVTGGLLEELLEKHGISQKELASIRLNALDGYSMEIPSEVLKNRDIILGYETDGKPLLEENQPIRIVVPEERGMYWVRSLSTIEITEATTASNNEVEKILIFDIAIENLDKEDYEYYENIDKAIKTQDLLKEFVPEGEEQVFMKAADDHKRNETKETFKNAFIKISGKESPVFLSPDMPKGMHVKHIVWFSTERIGFLTVEKAFEYYSPSIQGEKQGIPLKEVVEDMNLKQGDTYIFTANDGYSVEILKNDIDKGILYKKNNGNIGVSFEGLAKNTEVRNLLSIEVK